jgi:hypothetical protein
MPLEVFISYAHKDRKLRAELAEHLSNLRNQQVITEWFDGDIIEGTEWESQILTHLHTAQVILLLISASFLASNFCYSTELTEAISRHDAGQARVIPIILRPVDWTGTSFAKLQALPTYGRPVSQWRSHDEAFANVVQGIRRAIEDLYKNDKAVPQIKELQDLSHHTDDPEKINRFRTQQVGDKVIDGVRKELEQLPWANQSQRLPPKARKKLFLALRNLFVRKSFREKVEECLDQNWGSRLRIACLTKEVLRDYQTYMSRFEASVYRLYEQLLVEVDEYCLGLMGFFKLSEPYHTLDDLETYIHSAEEFKNHLPNRLLKPDIPPENIARSDKHLERIHELVEKLTAEYV